MTDKKSVNIRKLRLSNFIKLNFYPILTVLEYIGLRKILSRQIDSLMRYIGIDRSQEAFFRYKGYSELFRRNFTSSNKKPAPTIVFPSMLGVNSNLTLVNLLLAKEASGRGYEPCFLVCDSAVPVCSRERTGKTRSGRIMFCHECRSGYKRLARVTGLRIFYFSDFLNDNESRIKLNHCRAEIKNKLKNVKDCTDYVYDELPLGEIARKSVLRFFLTGEFSGSRYELRIYKSFLLAAVMEYLVLTSFFRSFSLINAAVFNNGTLQFEKLVSIMAGRRNINFMTHETYLGSNSLIFKKNDEVMNLSWLDEYKRYISVNSWSGGCELKVREHFHAMESGRDMYAILNDVHEEARFNSLKEFAVLFTNLNFDTAVLGKRSCFDSMKDWLLSVIDFWQTNEPGLYLLIRIHPGEVKLRTATREFMGDFLKGKITSDRIIVVDTEEKVNSYELIKRMKFGIIYSSTIGLEIAFRGKACLVGGAPFFRDQPYMISPGSRELFFTALGSLINGWKFTPDIEELKRQVYYLYFVRNWRLRMIKTRTPLGEDVVDASDSETLQSANSEFLEAFFTELMQNEG